MGLGFLVSAVHRTRLSQLCTAYVLAHRRHRQWVMKMQAQIVQVTKVNSTAGIWRSLRLHRFSVWAQKKLTMVTEESCT